MSEPDPGRRRSAIASSRIIGLAVLTLLLLVHMAFGPDLSAPWRREWFDLLQRIEPRVPVSRPVTVVVIDDNAVDRENGFGQWPWPRDLMGTLTFAILTGGPKAIGFDIYFSEPDRHSPRNLAREFFQDPPLAAALAAKPDTDEDFVSTLIDSPVVLSVAGRYPVPRTACQAPADWATRAENAPLIDDGVVARLPCFREPVALLPDFAAAAEGIAAISIENRPDGIVRRVDALQQIGPRVYGQLALETMRVAAGIERFETEATATTLTARLGRHDVPLERDGSFWVHFAPFDETRYVSARGILAEAANVEQLRKTFEDQYVLIAVTATGTWDRYITPLRRELPGVEVHAQMIEQIVDGTFLRRPWYMFLIETAALLLAGGAVIVLLPRNPPVIGILASFVWLTLAVVGGWLAFRSGLLIDIASPGLGLLIVTAAVGSVSLIETDRARLKTDRALAEERARYATAQLASERELARERERRARSDGELEAAGRIQQSLLPPARRKIAGRLDLACHIAPARMVGGDFYDHFMVDNRRLFLSVCDVSGKGAEASLFMAVSKSLWKSVALRQRWPLDAIQLEANTEISRDNSEMMFVTALSGLLDIETLELSYSSAGHDAPILFGNGRAPAQLESRSGPPAGLVEGTEFPVGNMRLDPGDRLCLFTDGVTEAMDPDRNLFGIDRLLGVLAGLPDTADSAAAVAAVTAAVAEFASGAEPSDDLTLMVLTILPAEELSEPG